MDLGRRPPLPKKKGLGRQANSDHKGFWKEQQDIRNGLVNKQNEDTKIAKDRERQQREEERQKEIKKVEEEARIWNESHGNSGNFLKDFKYGFKTAKKKFFDPVMNVANKAAPVLDKIPIASAALKSANAFDKVASKVN
jgi:hypothetical protein